jgi:hypothetical protein
MNKIFTKKFLAVFLMVVVMITNLINVANAQALNTKFKGNISTIYSKDGKNLEVIRDGKKILSVTRKNTLEGIISFKMPNGKESFSTIKITPTTDNEYEITITDMQSLEIYHVKSKINPLSDYIFNHTSSTVKFNQNIPDALLYYAHNGKWPDFQSIAASALAGASGEVVKKVTEVIIKNWPVIRSLITYEGIWAAVSFIISAPELAGIITGAAATAIVF